LNLQIFRILTTPDRYAFLLAIRFLKKIKKHDDLVVGTVLPHTVD